MLKTLKLKTRIAATTCGAVATALLNGSALAAEPDWNSGPIIEAKNSAVANPIAAAFLDSLMAIGRNRADAVRVEAEHDALERGYGKCAATIPVNGTTDKVFIRFAPYGSQHSGPEKFYEREFIQFRNGSYWTHVDLKQGFPGSPLVETDKAIISSDQHQLGVSYGLYSGLDLLPHTMKLWKHKVTLGSYLQGSTRTFFEIATVSRDGRTLLVVRTAGTPEEIIVDPAKGFALVEHTYVAEGLKMSTKVLEYQEFKPGVWIPKKAEHTFAPAGSEPTVIKLNVLDFKILPIKELDESLHYPFPPGWTITDERIGRTFTVGEPPAGIIQKQLETIAPNQNR